MTRACREVLGCDRVVLGFLPTSSNKMARRSTRRRRASVTPSLPPVPEDLLDPALRGETALEQEEGSVVEVRAERGAGQALEEEEESEAVGTASEAEGDAVSAALVLRVQPDVRVVAGGRYVGEACDSCRAKGWEQFCFPTFNGGSCVICTAKKTKCRPQGKHKYLYRCGTQLIVEIGPHWHPDESFGDNWDFDAYNEASAKALEAWQSQKRTVNRPCGFGDSLIVFAC